ncbi:MAG TPA: polyribonucleotide nucleotidyltransferase, partial [Acidimicrobiales bacterium]|nr:polyribonucleotide nucleotidyltransferase [Acidimicrobiales bacterium]
MTTEPTRVSAPIPGADKELVFETGKLAPQSQGAVVVSIGGTKALVTANAAKSVREGMDFFPLTVDVEERMYAAGRIPGSFFRREGRPTDLAILTCRLTDRPLRPSFPDGYRNETQIVSTIMGVDGRNPYDVLTINGASAALMLSGIPFEGPIGAVRMAFDTDGEWVPHPEHEEIEESTFDLVVAGREADDGSIAIMMVEANGTEKAWQHYQAGAPFVTEEAIAQGLEEAKKSIKDSIDAQRRLVEEFGSRPPLEWTPVVDYSDDVYSRVEAVGTDRLRDVAQIAIKAEREAAEREVKQAVVSELAAEFEGREKEIGGAIKALLKKLIRTRVVNEGVRIDGRGPADLRPVSAEVGILETAHGSGLFQRGETQVLNVLTLGMPKMDQLLDNLGPQDKKRYMHHYNMPPHANGETGRVGSPKRREIGHGLLAERALLPVIPSMEEWPYTFRLVSEVLASNGSTSMASVCSSTLSLMDGGVPIKAPVAGIAMGLIYEDGKYTTLTDILGAEDAFGDMDFKVAGTPDFVTALQLDTKIDGLPADVLASALAQAKEARTKILGVMTECIAEPREDVQGTAPKIISFEIPVDKIGEVIGPKGKVINQIQGETGADIGVDDDGVVGVVTIGGTDKSAVDEARRQIELIVNPPSAHPGEVYMGKVVNITKFGAFVNILPGRDGLLHISKIGGKRRIERVEDELELGQEIEVRVDDIDPNGKISLSPTNVPEGDESDEGPRSGGGRERSERPRRDSGRGDDTGGTADGGSASAGEFVSFEDAFDEELKEEFGDLGPESASSAGGEGGGGGRGGRGRSGGGGRGGRRR